MIPFVVVFLLVAVTDWVAVARGWRRVELVAKPAAMLVLVALLLYKDAFGNLPLLFVTLGILFSLAGDVFLLLAERFFLPGLVAFLLAHVAYIAALNIPLPDVSPLWSLGLAVLLAITASRILRRIIAGVQAKGLQRLVVPVAVYGVVITLMLLSALLTLYRTDWLILPAVLVSLGAALFYLSDVILALNKFVAPVKNGRLANMAAYHLGQFAIVVGALLQFAP